VTTCGMKFNNAQLLLLGSLKTQTFDAGRLYEVQNDCSVMFVERVISRLHRFVDVAFLSDR
jgi:hypothetical protein